MIPIPQNQKTPMLNKTPTLNRTKDTKTGPQLQSEGDQNALKAAMQGPSRRSFLKAGAASALATGLAASTVPRAFAGGQSLDRSDDILLLLDKATQGFCLPDYYEALALGYDGYLEQQLDPDSIDDSALDSVLAYYPSLGMDYRELYINYGRIPEYNYIPFYELKAARILRSIYSRRQLLETMVEFWTDHFNIDHEKGPIIWFKTVDDREVIRKHALGNFGDMLRASAESGAMQYYLDNYLNIAEAPNENYARELLELHTLGVDGPYEEFDVKNVARCLTGWTIWNLPYIDYGKFVFIPELHDEDQKIVLGNVIPPGGGKSDGDTVIDILLAHDKTADFVSRKMCKFLLSYDPPEGLVQAVAQTFQNTGGDIKSMLRVIFDRSRLRTADGWGESKFKRPYHYTVSLIRAVKGNIADFDPYYLDLLRMGHYPFGWPTPDGYPDKIEAWGTNILPRWSFAAKVMDGTGGIDVDLSVIIDILGGDIDPTTFGQSINLILKGGAMPEDEVAVVQDFIDSQPTFNESVARQAIGIAAASPSYQYY